MSASPKFKVYSDTYGYVGCCKFAEDAGALAALHGHNATVRYDHRWVVWREGHEHTSAADSVDEAAATMRARLRERGALRDDGVLQKVS